LRPPPTAITFIPITLYITIKCKTTQTPNNKESKDQVEAGQRRWLVKGTKIDI